MITETIVKVSVTANDIKQSNRECNPVSMAVARIFGLNEYFVQAQINSIIIFNDYDSIESVWGVNDNSKLSGFMDSWDLHQLGHKVELDEFTFTINKK
jgi:hypothetical protein|tara:strand:+ start:245 stop:538 length:294 start_codon:yes stop_codon:yes gene_type:complete